MLGLTITLVCTGCSVNPEQSTTPIVLDDTEISVESTSSSREDKQESSDKKQKNQALDFIDDFGEVGNNRLLAVKNYFYEMGWAEANQIEHLERLDFRDTSAYFLVIPCHPGSSLKVESLIPRDNGLVPDEILYEIQSTPDNYAIIINSQMPEGIADKQVTVYHGAEEATFRFQEHDLRGDLEVPRLIDDVLYTEARTSKDVQSPKAEQENQRNHEYEFTDGVGEETPQTLQVGDTFGDWRVESIDVYSYGLNPPESIEANFKGSITVRGDAVVETAETLVPGRVTFYVADDMASLFPKAVIDSRATVHFTFSNNEEAKQMLGLLEEGMERKNVEITIRGYYYVYAPKMVINITELVECLDD